MTQAGVKTIQHSSQNIGKTDLQIFPGVDQSPSNLPIFADNGGRRTGGSRHWFARQFSALEMRPFPFCIYTFLSRRLEKTPIWASNVTLFTCKNRPIRRSDWSIKRVTILGPSWFCVFICNWKLPIALLDFVKYYCYIHNDENNNYY